MGRQTCCKRVGNMRACRFAWLLTLLSFCGCGPTTSLETRLKAAMAMSDPVRKDAALERVATEAAQAGKPSVVTMALSNIADGAMRDATSEACALGLARSGWPANAAEVALKISDPRKRDYVLGKLTK